MNTFSVRMCIYIYIYVYTHRYLYFTLVSIVSERARPADPRLFHVCTCFYGAAWNKTSPRATCMGLSHTKIQACRDLTQG